MGKAKNSNARMASGKVGGFGASRFGAKPITSLLASMLGFGGFRKSASRVYRGRFFGQSEEAKDVAIANADKKRRIKNSKRLSDKSWDRAATQRVEVRQQMRVKAELRNLAEFG